MHTQEDVKLGKFTKEVLDVVLKKFKIEKLTDSMKYLLKSSAVYEQKWQMIAPSLSPRNVSLDCQELQRYNFFCYTTARAESQLHSLEQETLAPSYKQKKKKKKKSPSVINEEELSLL